MLVGEAYTPQTSLTCKFVCVCVCLSLYRSLSLSLCLSVSVSLSLSLFLSLSHPPLARLFPIPTTTTIHRSNIPPGLLFLSLLCLSLSLNRQVKTHSQRARLPPIEPLDILVIGSVRAFPPPRSTQRTIHRRHARQSRTPLRWRIQGRL